MNLGSFSSILNVLGIFTIEDIKLYIVTGIRNVSNKYTCVNYVTQGIKGVISYFLYTTAYQE